MKRRNDGQTRRNGDSLEREVAMTDGCLRSRSLIFPSGYCLYSYKSLRSGVIRKIKITFVVINRPYTIIAIIAFVEFHNYNVACKNNVVLESL